MEMRFKLLIIFLISLIVPIGVSILVKPVLYAYLPILLVPTIASLILIYIAGFGIDSYVQKKALTDNQFKSTFESRIMKGGYIGLGAGLALSLFILLQCTLRSCSESFITLFIPIIPVILLLPGILMGFLWNFRWGRILTYLFMIIIAIPVVSLILEMIG